MPREGIYTCIFCFVPLRLSSLSMAEATVPILPYVLEAVRPAAIPPLSYLLQRESLSDWISWRVSFSISFSQRVSLRVISQSTSLSVVMASVAFTLDFLGVCRLPVSHFWRESLSLVSWCLSYFALHFVFIACVAYKLFLWSVSPSGCFFRRVSPSSQPFLASVAYKLFSWRVSPRLQVVFMACVAFQLDVSGVCRFHCSFMVSFIFCCPSQCSQRVSLTTCFHGLYHLQVVFMACVALRLAAFLALDVFRLAFITCFALIFSSWMMQSCHGLLGALEWHSITHSLTHSLDSH